MHMDGWVVRGYGSRVAVSPGSSAGPAQYLNMYTIQHPNRMEPELRGELEMAADELVTELVDLGLAETGQGPPSTEYILGMMEVTLYGMMNEQLSESDMASLEGEQIVREVRQIVYRREDDVRTELNQHDGGSINDATTKIFDS